MLILKKALLVHLLASFPAVFCLEACMKPPASQTTPRPKPPVVTANPSPRDPDPTNGGEIEDPRSLDELYANALQEGCHAIIYAGGDTPGQQDWWKSNFEKRFANCVLDFVVDYSKSHDARIELQLERNHLIPDLVQLQTLQDFTRWKERGLFMRYKPRGWSFISDDYKDPEGYFVGIYIIVFASCANKQFRDTLRMDSWDMEEFTSPTFKGPTVITYPNDDDAILYVFKRVAETQGWGFLEKLAQNNVTWVRGTQEPGDATDAGRVAAVPVAWCSMVDADWVKSEMHLPKTGPFTSWAQTAAIFKEANNSATAKLYLSWIVDAETQTNLWSQWSVRSDVAPPPKFGPISKYSSQTSPVDFREFMHDRALVEGLRAKVTIFIGEPQGPPTPHVLGLYPVKAIPH